MDVMCAFVCGDALKVHEVPDDGVTIRDSSGAQYVARLASTFQRHPHVIAFRQRNLRRTRGASLHHTRETQCQQLRLGDLLQHPDTFLLYQLETGDRAAKLLAPFGVRQRCFIAINGCADDTPCDSYPRMRET